MATPTGTTPTSSSTAANKRPAGSGNVTTPSHLSHHTSPAPPRSVPSPATARSHTAGKTPTSSSQQGSKTLAGSGGETPMMRNLSQATSNPSPSAAGLPSSAAAAAASSASATGGGGAAQHHHSSAHLPATPSLLPGSAGGSGIGSAGPGPGSVPMGPSLSEMGFSLSLSRSLSSSGGMNGGGGAGLGIAGIGSSGLSGAGGGVGGSGSTGVHRLGAANEDSLRRTRLRRILGGLARPAGRVSEEGIARVARRVGFAIDLDDGGGLGAATAEAEGRIGNRTVTVAGNTVMIELDLKNNIPRSVNVAVNGGGEAMRDEEKRAGEVLLKGLRVSDESGGGVCGEGLGRFARDLEALARIDRLSSQRVSCFEALSGVYGCLRRLWKVELEAASDELKKSGTSRNGESSEEDIEDRAEALVMEKKSGMPSAHSRGRIGWELVYWHSGRRGTKGKRKQASAGGDDMEIDGGNRKANNDTSSIDQFEDGTTFSLQLENESSPAGLFPSLRISDAWLPEAITLPPPDSAESLPWQDPPPTFLAPDDNADSMAVDGGPEHQKIPDLRFVARLEPPLVLPYPIAVQILASVGLPAPNVMTLPPQYAAAAIDPGASAHVQPGTFSHSAKQTVLSMADGRESVETHVYTLDTAKPDWSYTLHEVPYSHPRQLVDLLPTLRQWAQVGTLLRQALAEEETPASSSERLGPRQLAESNPSTTSFSLSALTSAPRKINVKMPEDSAADKSSTCAINILLNTAPVPTFKFTFPPSKASESASTSSQNHKQEQQRELANVTMQVLANAELAVVAYDGLDLPPAKHAGAGTEESKEAHKDGDKEDREEKEPGEENKKRDEGANGDEKPGQSEGETRAQEAVDKENGMLKQRQDAQKRLAGALAVCGDARIWVEWMRNMT